MVSIQDTVKLICSESQQLRRYLDGLSQGALNRPSACDRWEIGDVIAHLVWLAEFCLDVISRGVQSDTSPPERFLPAGSASQEWINEHFYQSAIARRASLGVQLVPMFGARYEQLYYLMAGLSPQDWAKPCYHERGNRPARRFTTTVVNELVIHGWDIRSELEPSAHLSAEVLPVLIERIQQRFRNPRSAAFLLGSKLPAHLRYRLEMTGAVPGKEDIVVEDGKCWIELAAEATTDATIRCDTETFVLLMNRRLLLDSLIGQ